MIEPWCFDLAIFKALNFDGGGALDFLMYYASGKLTWVPLYGFLMWLVWQKLGWRGLTAFGVVCAAMILCADQTATLFKTITPKLRPSHYEPLAGIVHTVYGYEGGLYGTVSSHAANAISLTLLVGLVVRKRWLWMVLGLWTAIMCYSRIYLGVHYPMDVVFGLVDGAIWGGGWWCILRKLLSLRIFNSSK